MPHVQCIALRCISAISDRSPVLRLMIISTLIGACVALATPIQARAQSSGCTWHTVVAGDTLGNLGWQYHSNALTIAAANSLADPDLIFVGQRLCIPAGVTSRTGGGSTTATCIWHTVVAGDTLGKLGWRTPGGALGIASANNIPNPDLIYVGQRICIPTNGGVAQGYGGQAPASDPVPRATPTPSGIPALPALAPGVQSVSGAQAFIQFALPYARAAHLATGWPTSLILAQWGLEQGWHVPSYTGYNFGNCGAVPGAIQVPGLNVPGSPATFSYAPTPQEGLRIYVYVAHLNYYVAVARAAASGGPDAAARALGQSPWDAAHYTATGNPGSSLIAILHAYNLYRYDG